MVHQEDTVKVIDLMTNGLREKTICPDVPPVAVRVLGPDDERCGSFESREEARERETPLLETGLSLASDDRRIGEDDLGLRIFADREVDRREPQIDADLGRGKAETGRLPPGLEEVFDQCAQRLVEILYRGVLRLEARIAVDKDRADTHQSSAGAVTGPIE